MEKLLRFLDRLEAERIHYTLGHFRDSINVLVTVPGERWEIEFMEDGTVEVEIFASAATTIGGEGELARLFERKV